MYHILIRILVFLCIILIITCTKQQKKVISSSIIDLFQDNLNEIEIPIKLNVQGNIPDYVNGIMIQNGPGVFGTKPQQEQESRRSYSHIFDGLSKISKYDINKDGISFQTKFLRSKWYEDVVKNNKIPPSITTGAVLNPPFSTFENIYAAITSSFLFDNTPVNIARLGGRKGNLVATTDAPVLMEFDKSLNTKGRIQYSNSITSLNGIELFSTAHPISLENESINYFLELKLPIPFLKSQNLAHFVSTNTDKERKILGTYEIDKVPYVHSFGMTDRYIILTIWPLFMNPINVANGKGFLSQLEWMPEIGSEIIIFDRHNTTTTSPIRKFKAPPLFAYHHINAYENEDNYIIFDVTGYETPDIINGENAFAKIPNILDPAKRKKQARDGRTYRFKLPMTSTKSDNYACIEIEPIALNTFDQNQQLYTNELLVINENFRRKKYKFTYGFTGFAGSNENNNGGYNQWALVKTNNDIAVGEGSVGAVTIWSEENCFPTEAQFVPANFSVDEDEEDNGILLSQVYDGNKKQTFLLGLNAKTMTEVFRAYTGERVPIAFHGIFIHRDEI